MAAVVRRVVWAAARRRCSTAAPASVLDTLQDRGLVNNVTAPQLRTELQKPTTVYCGYDPTARSLHVGNLVSLVTLAHLRAAGHRVVALVGGATGVVGDPSGRQTERTPMQEQILLDNVEGLKKAISQVFNNVDALQPAQSPNGIQPWLLVNNRDWYEGFNVVDFMARVGRHFRVPTMLSRESVQQRINSGEGISFAEFSYQIFQAYDFLVLHQQHECTLQVGGSDQWGNICGGCDLIRKVTGNQAFGVTTPLITTSDGAKLGKSAGNAVWLDSSLTSPFEFYQYFLGTADSDVERLLKCFSFLPLQAIEDVMKQHAAAPEKRHAQHVLAREATLLVHGKAGLEQAEASTAVRFGEQGLSGLSDAALQQLAQSADSVRLQKAQLEHGMLAVDAAVKCGLCASKREATRVIASGGLYINDNRVEGADSVLTLDDVLHGQFTQVRRGRKQVAVVVWQ